MPSSKDRRTWFGLGRRPRLPDYLQPGKGKRRAPKIERAQRIKLKPRSGRRLKGLDEFEKPEFVGRMARFQRRQNLEWWGLMFVGVALGGAIGWFVI